MNLAQRLEARQIAERTATEAISKRAAWAGDYTREQLRDAQAVLEWLASQARAAYESMDSPHDQYGNPTDYAGVEHQAMLQVNKHAEQLDSARALIAKMLDHGDIR